MGNSIPGRRINKCKGPKVRVCLVNSGMARGNVVSGATGGTEGRRWWGPDCVGCHQPPGELSLPHHSETGEGREDIPARLVIPSGHLGFSIATLMVYTMHISLFIQQPQD